MFRLQFVALLCACFMTASLSSYAKDVKSIKVVPVNQDDDAANSGVVYALPKTLLRVRVDAELTIEKVGPFYKYSNKYLNISDVITQDSKSWKIVSASVETKSIADLSKRYKIYSDNSSSLPCVALSSDGILRGLNIPYSEDVETICEANPSTVDDVDFLSVPLNQQVLTKTSNAAMAEQAAQSIYSLRDKRLAILGGEESTLLSDAGSYDRVLAEISRLEQEHLELFVGKRKVVRITRYFEIEPSSENEVIARFSEKDGFLSTMDLTGKPIYIEVSTGSNEKLHSYPEGSKQRKAAPLNGLRYCIPVVATVKVLDRNNLLVEKQLLISQGGQIATLPVSYLTDENVQILFEPSTGALLSISTNKDKK